VTEPSLPGNRRPLLIGHKGLPVLAPENTLRSLELALDHGADSFEVDVVALADGTLVLGHSLELEELCHGAANGSVGDLSLAELRALDPELATLDEALELVAGKAGVRPILIDLKLDGIETAVIEAVRTHALAERALLCSLDRRSLVRARAVAPEIARSLSYPADTHRISRRRGMALFARAATRTLRIALPWRIGRWLEETGAVSATLHHSVIDRSVVARCHAAGALVFAWTVNDADGVQRMVAAGIDGIISDDSRSVVAALE